jgi:Cdc6-like AAA superfamily ATPase
MTSAVSTDEDEVLAIQAAFMQFDRRAEKVSQEILTKTFVDAEPLFIQLSSKNHQILYGRRGTGKTHALKYLAEKISEAGGIPIYIDLRVIGSNGSIYTDLNRSLSERATRLVTDVLAALENELIQISIAKIDSAPNASLFFIGSTLNTTPRRFV